MDTFAWIGRILGAALIAGTLLPLLRTGHWFVRGWDFPRLQVAGLLAVGMAFLLFRLYSRGANAVEPFVWLVLCGAAFIWQMSHVVSLTPVWPVEVADSPADSERHRICIANLKYDNPLKDSGADQILGLDADVLILIEVNEDWKRALAEARQHFPYHHEEVHGEGLGLVVWSRIPVATMETQFVVEERRPSIWAELTFGRCKVNLVAVHPTPPGLMDSTGDQRRNSRVRDAELIGIAKTVAERRDENWIVAGDLNDVAWSHTTRLFKRLSGMKDPRTGRSIMGTFHATNPLIRFPIDHIFLSEGFSIASLQRFKIEGSDHFVLAADVSLIDPTAGVEPEPVHDDKRDAKEIVEQGLSDASDRDVAAKSSLAEEIE